MALFLFTLSPAPCNIMQRVDSVEYLIDETPDIPSKINQIITLSNLVITFDKREAAILAKRALYLSNQTTHDCLRATTCNHLAFTYCELNKSDSALMYYDLALQTMDTVTCIKELVKYYIGKGMVYRDQGNFIKSVEYHERALEISEKINDTLLIVTSLRTLGIPLTRLGRNAEALQDYFRALPMAESISNAEELAYLYNNISIVYLGQDQVDKALPYLLRSQELLQKLDYKSKLMTININLATLYRRLDSLDLTFLYYATAEKIANEIHDTMRLGIIYSNLGGIYSKTGDYRKGNVYQLKAYRIAKKKNLNLILHGALFELGLNHYYLNQPGPAKEYLEQSLDVAVKMQYHRGLAASAENLSMIYEEEGKYKDALAVYKIFLQAKDSIYKDSRIEEITRMEMQYEFDKVQHDKDLLNLRKTMEYEKKLRQEKILRNFAVAGIILILGIGALVFFLFRLRHQQKFDKLQNELFQYMQKSMSQQMNPHFIFNTLTSIQYFFETEEKDKGMEYVQKFATLMRTALNNSQQATISIADELEFVRIYASLEEFRFRIPFELQIRVDEAIDQKKMHIPAFLIQPLVENSIKHGIMPMHEKGTISIVLKNTGDRLLCIVEDNGMGIDSEKPKHRAHKSVSSDHLKKRLQLLGVYYNRDFSLNYTKSESLHGKYPGTRVALELPIISN